MKKIIFTAIALFVSTLVAFSANYYASPDGTGNGSLANPCSLTEGILKLANGSNDTLFVRGGEYELSSQISINRNGTSACRLAIFAYKDEKPILDFRGQLYSYNGNGNTYNRPGISLNQASTYMHIKGLTIRYASDNGMINNGSYHIIENCVFHENCDSGLQHKNGCGNLILNCDSYDNFDYQTGGTNRADFGGNADGFADKQYTNNGEPNIYDGCRAWGNADDGWDFFQKIGNTIIRNSFCYNNGPTTYDMRNHPRYNTDKAWFDRFPLTVTDRYDASVTINLQNYTNYGNGNGFKVGGELTAHNVRLEHCLAANNRVRGFDQNNNAGEMILLNCSGFGNTPNYGFNNNKGGKLTVTNCVSLPANGDRFNTQTVVSIANNAWNTAGVSCNAADFINTTDVKQMTSPRKPDGSLPDMTFMHLAEGSDLIDKGVNVGLPYGGAAPDFGCFESGDDSSYPPIVSTPDNRNQSVNQNTAITDIVFTWSGSATGLEVNGLPKGLTTEFDAAKTLTIKGSPSEMGAFDYTVTTLQEEENTTKAMSVSGTIIVKSENAKQIAFVTIPNSAEDALILEKLNDNLELNITIIDATAAGVDYSSYDMIILSAKPASNSAGLGVLKNINKPTLLLKPFQLKPIAANSQNTWGWVAANGDAVNTTQTTVTVENKNHEIFTGLEFVNDNELVLFSQVTTYAVTGIAAGKWLGNPSFDLLGVAKGTTTQSIVDIPSGTTINATTINNRLLMIGLSEYSTAYLTPTATQLIENACYYLMGENIPSSVNDVEEDTLIIKQENGQISVEGVEVAALTLYAITGHRIASAAGAQLSVPDNRGVYILSVRTTAGTVINRKVIIQ